MAAASILVCALSALLIASSVFGLGQLPKFQQEIYPDGIHEAFRECQVAMNPSGTRAVIGSFKNNSALIYDRIGNTWSRTAVLHYTDTSPARLQGFFVAISRDGNTVVSSDAEINSNYGAAYVFRYSGGAWDTGVRLLEPVPGFNHYFGWGTAISQDGNTIGIATEVSYGGVLVFGRTGSANAWHPQGILTYETSDSNHAGQSIRFSSNGALAVYGAPYDAGDYGTFGFFKRNSTMGWNQSGPTISSPIDSTDYFGWRMAMSADGEIVLVSGFPGAWVYYLTGGGTTYALLETLVAPGSTSYYGSAAAMTTDGKRIVLGDRYANVVTITQYNTTYAYTMGGAFIFDRLGSPSTPYTLIGNITVPFIQSGSAGNSYSAFGAYAMAVSDENHVLVTAYQVNNYYGAAFFFASGGACHPDYSLSKSRCVSRNNNCGGSLKWTGKGCRAKKGTVRGDGGCQCKGYCGYTCRGACNKDKECVWATARNSCYVKATGQPGAPITSC